MDLSQKTFIEFKPNKKMRTRRELNKLSNKCSRQNSQRSLLILDSESSDDEFVKRRNNSFRK